MPAGFFGVAIGVPVDLAVDVYRVTHRLISGGADWDLSSGLGPAAEVHELAQVTACFAGAAEASVLATCVRGLYSRDLDFWELSLIFTADFRNFGILSRQNPPHS